MHEKERHRIILSAVQDKPVITVPELVDLTDSSEATIRRDIAALHVQKRLRRVRGGAEAINPPQFVGLAGRPFSVNEGLHARQKQAIAKEAVALCQDGEPIIINGGTTTIPDGAFSRQSPHAGVHQFLSDRRASAQALEEHRDALGRHDLPRAEHHPQPLR